MRRSEDFRSAMRRGRRLSGRTLVVHALAIPYDQRARDQLAGDKPARVGIVVSKAVGNAVVRHRVQRRLRHAVRGHLARLGSSLVVIRALPPAATAGFGDLHSDLDRCLSGLERHGR
jgi:ribonuclease P protein component